MFRWLRDVIPWDVMLRTMIWLLSALVLGLFDLYTFRFDPRRFLNVDYLSEVGILVGLGIFIFAFRLVEKIIKLKALDLINSKLEETINGYVNGEKKLKHLIGFIVFANLKRRETAYRERMQKKIGRILEKLSDDEMKQYTWEAKTENEMPPKRSKKVIKLIRLQSQMTPEYIEDNKDYLSAKFVRLTPNYMTSGFNGKKSGSANQNPSRRFRTAFGDNLMSFTIPTMLVAFVIGSVLIANEADVWAIVLIVSIKLLLLLFQHWSASMYAPTYLGKTWIYDLHFRKTLWEQYFGWIIQFKSKGGDINGSSKHELQQ